VKEDTMNRATVCALERRLAKIEKQRGATDADNPFNDILRSVGEPPCTTSSEAFLCVLKLMQTPDWNERLRAGRTSE
jgi:mannose/cellobiose epimerase-like protein (N-acyl-D-glucosamine 2-epimerase family)